MTKRKHFENRDSTLDNVMIAAPCNIGWDNMVGDDRVRLCAGCDKNVYNTSRMTKAEIKELLAVDDNEHCLRIYRRADGTMITEDCPVGMRRVRDAWRRVAKVAASIWACALSLAPSWGQNANQKIPPIVEGSAVLTEGGRFSPENTSVKFAKTEKPRMDRSAFLSFQSARTAAQENKTEEADENYNQALRDLERGTHDPKFAELVYHSYAEFLRANGKTTKANDVMDLLAKYKSIRYKTPEPTVIDGGRLSSGRAERHQKTSPTLPEGAPIPDNE